MQLAPAARLIQGSMLRIAPGMASINERVVAPTVFALAFQSAASSLVLANLVCVP